MHAKRISDLNTNINRVTVHAIVDVPAGQEITVCYCLPYYCQRVRRHSLAKRDVVCSCGVCQPTQTRILEETQRVLMQGTWESLHDIRNQNDPLLEIHQMIKLLRDAGLNVEALSMLYQRAVEIHVRSAHRSDRSHALECAEKQLELEIERLGSDSPLTQKTQQQVQWLKIGL